MPNSVITSLFSHLSLITFHSTVPQYCRKVHTGPAHRGPANGKPVQRVKEDSGQTAHVCGTSYEQQPHTTNPS